MSVRGKRTTGGPAEDDSGPRRPKRRMRGPARRERILEAAMGVFAERGYDSTSMGRIADAAGVSRPVVYDHFPSKRELHLTLLEREAEQLTADVGRVLTPEGSPRDRYGRAIEAFFTFVEERPYAWRMLFRESAGDAETVARHRAIQSEQHLAVARAFAAEDPGRPELADERRLEMLAELWGTAVNGLARWWYERPDVPRAEVVAATMDALWLGVERLLAGERWER
jgi:AcrR family transcriptional regulator